jgi:hypothetical protein
MILIYLVSFVLVVGLVYFFFSVLRRDGYLGVYILQEIETHGKDSVRIATWVRYKGDDIRVCEPTIVPLASAVEEKDAQKDIARDWFKNYRVIRKQLK